MTTKSYIVVFDDEYGACWPMSWDADCAGALVAMTRNPVALFQSRTAARKAVRISTAYARLCAAQGKPENSDFTDGLRLVKIIECKPEAQP